MAKKYTSKLQSLKSAQQYIADFDSATPEIQYVFIGKTDAYDDDDTPFDIEESFDFNDRVFTDMIAAKRVKSNDVNLVIPRVNWQSGMIYRQYDPQQLTDDLISSNTSQNLEPMYVFTEGRNVYKCLSNNSGTLTANVPTGDYTTSNGVITNPTTGGGDGYIWKYMYSIRAENKFLNSSFLPVPTRNNQSDETDSVFNLDNTGVVEGELTTIVVADGGAQYRNFSNIRVEPFLTGDTVLTVNSAFMTSNMTSITVDDIANDNMSITGTGIQADTHVLSIDDINNKITLNKAASSNGGGSNVANNISTTTRVFIDGDGTDALANATVVNGVVTKITVDTIGKNYEKCNALVFGTGTGVDSRVILAPKFGHGFNLAKDLVANSVMVTSKIGEIDSTENGIIPVDIQFRQIGLIRNPHKYDTDTAITDATANDVVSQVTTLQLSAGVDYIQGEKVFQGVAANVNFAQAVVHRVTTSTEIEVTGVEGEFRTGVVLNGVISSADRFVVAVTNPEFEPDSAEVLYIENLSPITRIDGQAEDIRLILQF
tara:strand:+ start:12367 stop:13992 length:1626 start_codon:yes stop_codon:yes gene_type:complete